MRLQHPALYDAVSSLQCPRCFITFRDLQTSLQHMRLQHPALYKRRLRARTVFACRRCERTFPSSRQLSTHQRAHRQGREAGREEGEGQEEERQDAQPTSPSLLPLPDRHKCPHCNFLFRDAKTKMRHMNVKDPTGCPLPPPLFFSTGDEEREEEEEVVMAVQVKEEDEGEVKHEEDDFSTALRHRGNLNPASLHQGEGKEGVVKVPIKPDAGDVRTKEETIEGVCECALCGKGFEQLLAAAGQRRRGRRREHSAPPGARGHACGHCRQLCHSQEALRQHQRLHTLERPYLCQDCGNTFKRASGLQRHRSIHTQVLYSATTSTQPAPELQDRLSPPVPQIHSVPPAERAPAVFLFGLLVSCSHGTSSARPQTKGCPDTCRAYTRSIILHTTQCACPI
ncbi:zinc finger protein 420-like isoform X5 [Anguilla anguilla]|uniref:zinc finger protein 420-like isoform X5 n=1 Tax=Anguilla anguilla TaxID=7936 RepID=UPI0015B3644F|nr:zinc finger protein 420-like isoform X5 [Anguilla anguilla]